MGDMRGKKLMSPEFYRRTPKNHISLHVGPFGYQEASYATTTFFMPICGQSRLFKKCPKFPYGEHEGGKLMLPEFYRWTPKTHISLHVGSFGYQ